MKKILFSLIPLASLAAEECCDPCVCWKLSISPIVWQAHEEGLDYAIKNQSGLAFISDHGDVKRIDSDWDWGVRLNFEYQTNCVGDVELMWTYYNTDGTSSASAPFPEALFPVWTTPGATITSSTSAKAKWELCLNLLDLRLGARYNPTCYLELRPFIALSTAWIDQDFRIETSGGTSTGGAALIVLDDSVKMKNDYWGIGPKLGVKANWDLGCGFTLFGNVDGSILYGDFCLTQKEKVLFEGLTPKTTYLDLKNDSFWLSRVYLDFLLGFRWEWCLCCGDYSIGFEAGWENLVFFGQNQLKRFTDDTNPGIHVPVNGDLTIQGITLSATFGF